MKRIQDTLTEELKNSLGNIRMAAIKIWHSPQHRSYTDHKPEGHSERIIEKLGKLLVDVSDDLMLVPEEVYVLLASAYLHDIGMQSEKTQHKTLDEIRDHHHEISREMILGSVQDREQYPDLGVLPDFVDEVALVSAAHRRLDLTSDEFNDRPKGGATLRLRLLSALLRLADELDMDSRRVIMSNIKVADVPQSSRLHWWRCDFVEAVSIQNGVIIASCVVPSEDYSYYIKTSVERGLRDAVDKSGPFLWPTVKLSVGPSIARISSTKTGMGIDDFAAFRAQVAGEVQQSSQKAFAEIRDLRDREQRAATLLGEEAQRIRDKDPPRAADLHRQAAILFQQLGMAHSTASQMEALAKLLEQQGQAEQAAEVHEELSQLWVVASEPFRARGAMEKSIALTPSESIVVLNFRKCLFVNILTLLGDFGNAQQSLQQISEALQSNSSFLTEQGNLLAAFMAAKITFLTASHEWSQALLQCQTMLAGIEQSSPPQQVNYGCYEFSVIASHAGDHILAQKWINRAGDAWKEALTTDSSLALVFHARRGYVYTRASMWEAAFKEFETALELAERIGDERAMVVQYENLLKVSRRIPEQEKAVLIRWSGVADLGEKLRAVLGDDDLGLASDKEHLYDSLAHYLNGFRQAMADNSLSGITRSQNRLAGLYEKAGRWPFALKLYATINSKDEIEALASKLAGEGNADAGTYASDLVQQLGSTLYEQAGLGVLVAAMADVIPDERVAAVAERLMAFCKEPAGDLEPARSLLPALSVLADRMNGEAVRRCVSVALTLLSQEHSDDWQTQKAAAEYLAVMAHGIPADMYAETMARLSALMSKPQVGLSALGALVDLEPHLAEPQRSEVREMVRGLALDKGQFWPCEFYVRAGYGSLGVGLGRSIINGYLVRMQKQEQMADSNNWTIDAGPSMWSMKYFKEYVQPDQAHVVAKILTRLMVHSENFPAHREDAIAALGYLANTVPSRLITKTVQSLVDLADRPEIGPVMHMMINTGIDPLQRHRFHLGIPEDIRGTATAALGQFCIRLRGKALRQILRRILDASGDAVTAVRVGAAMALYHSHSVLRNEDLHTAVTQLYGLLHDPEPDVQQAAVYSLVSYAQMLTKREAQLCLHRLLILSRTGKVTVRLRAVWGLRVLTDLPVLVDRKAEVEAAFMLMQGDVSYHVRRAVREAPIAEEEVILSQAGQENA